MYIHHLYFRNSLEKIEEKSSSQFLHGSAKESSFLSQYCYSDTCIPHLRQVQDKKKKRQLMPDSHQVTATILGHFR